jgi:FixJ family two-component response regulator
MDKKRILIIDDEQIVLDSVRKILSSDGYDVSTTLTAKIGVRRATNEPFHIVLTDIRMPDMDGLTVLRNIKRVKPTLPILIITGYATVSSAIQAMKLGAVNYIEKPFRPGELIRAVVAAMDSSSGILKEESTLIHVKETLKILKKGAKDPKFAKKVFEQEGDVLEKYCLNNAEKLAIITGDIDWIEDQVGIIEWNRKQWIIEGKRLYSKQEGPS